jgi:hypothetical protein
MSRRVASAILLSRLIHFDMQKVHWLLVLTVALAVCGCDNQTQVNTQKIDVLTQKMFILQQAQASQLAAVQKEVADLPPLMDRLEKKYFTESQDKALFYHTNVLYFLLTIDKRIQAQFEQADAARKASDQLAYFYHTNETDTAYFCSSQIADAINAQEKRVEANFEDRLRQADVTISNALAVQAKALTANQAQLQAEAAKRAEMEAKIIQMQSDLAQIKTTLQEINLQIQKLGAPPAPVAPKTPAPAAGSP